jgi:hypothetical protein
MFLSRIDYYRANTHPTTKKPIFVTHKPQNNKYKGPKRRVHYTHTSHHSEKMYRTSCFNHHRSNQKALHHQLQYFPLNNHGSFPLWTLFLSLTMTGYIFVTLRFLWTLSAMMEPIRYNNNNIESIQPLCCLKGLLSRTCCSLCTRTR